jgi:fucose permease
MVAVGSLLRATPIPVRRHVPPDAAAGRAGQARVPLAFVLVCLFFFVYVGVEMAFAGWVSTYAEQIRLTGPGVSRGDAPGVLAAVFWAGFAGGRVVAVWAARRIALVTMLVGSCVLATVAGFVLAIGDQVGAVVWATTAVVGCSLGPQYATMMAFGDERLRLSGRSASRIIASSGVGGLTLPVATGWILDRWGAALLPWTVGVGCVVTTVVTLATVAAGRQRPPLTSRHAPVT